MNYISVRQIMDDLLADDMMKGLSLERGINYAVEFIKVVGMHPLFEKKIATIEIKDHRGELPCDFYKEIQVRKPKGGAYIYATGSFNPKVPMTYRIQGHVIITSEKCGEVELAYDAFMTDHEGFPLIIDDGIFPRALELYIQKRYFTILFNSGKVSQAVLQNTQQEYAFYVGQAQNNLVKPTLDQMEAIKNMWNTLIPRHHKHAESFESLGQPERLTI